MDVTTSGSTDIRVSDSGAPVRDEAAPGGRTGLLQSEPSLLDRAKRGDRAAIDTMFGQFLPAGEAVRESDYLGVLGMWGFGTHSFAAVTDRRVATLRVGLLGAVTYQDGGLEHVNSGVVVQPSRWLLYAGATGWLLLPALLVLSVALSLAAGRAVTLMAVLLVVTGAVLLLPVLVSLHYRLRKCGMVLWVREGSNVYAFADRKLLRRANALYRMAQSLRERRLLVLRGGDGGRIEVPAQRPREELEPGAPHSRLSGVAVLAAGVLLAVGGLALPVVTAPDDPVAAVSTAAGPAADSPSSYGDDVALDALWDSCAAGNGEACNRLYQDSPSASEYEDYGATCGQRLPTGTDCTLYRLE